MGIVEYSKCENVGSSLLCSAVVSYDVTRFRVRAAIGIRSTNQVAVTRRLYSHLTVTWLAKFSQSKFSIAVH